MFIPDPGSELFHPGSEFFHPGSRVKKIPDPGPASKNLSILNPKIVSTVSVSDPDFLSIPDPGVKKTPNPGSESATQCD
jgi:hypothetical protein